MALTNKLKNQVDIPVWEWCRLAPNTSTAISSSAAADNSTYHVSFGRYIYYLQSTTSTAGPTGTATGFFRYDTVTDTYQQLSVPPVVPVTYTGMEFVESHGYYGRVLSAGVNTIIGATLTGQELKTFDIRIISGTGVGQQRVITAVSDPVIYDNGTLTAAAVSPQGNVTDGSKNWQINQWVGYQVRFIANTGQSQVRKIIYNTPTALFFADTTKYAEELNAFAPIVTVGSLTVPIAGTQYQIEAGTITVDTAWTTQPDSTSRFLVQTGGIWLIGAGTTSYLMEYYDVAADVWYLRNPASTSSPVATAGTDASIIDTGEVANVYGRGTATGSQSSTTLQDTTQSWTVNALSASGYKVRIFSGTGQGQVRAISSNTSNTITVATSWTTTPDATSLYLIDTLEGGVASGSGLATQTGASTATILGNTLTAGTTTGSYYPGQILTGTGVQDNITVVTNQAACYTAGLQTTVLLSYGSTTGITAGMYVTILNGTGALAAGTKVSSVGTFTITLSANVTTSLSGATLQFQDAYVGTTASSAGVVVTVASTTGLIPGMVMATAMLAGTGAFAVDTYVISVINSTTFTVSTTPTTALSGATFLAQSFQTVIKSQNTGLPGGAGTYTVWPPQTVASTTITGTGVATLTDSTKSWSLNRWNGMQVRIVAGTGMGQSRSIVGVQGNNTVAYTSSSGATSSSTTITVSSVTNLAVGMVVSVTAGTGSFAWNTTVVSINVGANTFVVSQVPTVALSGGSTVVSGISYNTLVVYPNWTTAPDSTSAYVIHGDNDKIYFSLSAQTPLFLHNVESDTVTMGRMMDYGVARSGAAQLNDQTAVAISSGLPVQTINYIVGTGAAYTSVAGATSSGTTVTVTTTNGLFVGCPITVSAGVGTFATGTYVAAITGTTTFIASATPSVTLSGGASVVSGVASALAYFGQGPFQTATLSGTGSTATATFTTLPGCTYSGSTTIPVNSLITIMGATPTGYNGTFVVTASSTGSVSWASAVSGSQTVAGVLSCGAQLPVGAAAITVAGCLPAGYNSASITTTAAAAGFITYANATTGLLSATGVITHLTQNTTACTIASTTATVTFAGNTIFPIGSYVSVVGVITIAAGSGSYNGVYQVTASSAGSVSYTISSNTPSGTASAQGTIQLATTLQWVTAVNNIHYKAGQSITHYGDLHYAASNTNITAAVFPLPGTTTQYTYTTSGAAGTMILAPQVTNVLVDVTKNWVPNQFANCVVTYNTTQYAGALTGATILSAYIIQNTATKLFFSAAQATAPVVGTSRYVISLPVTNQLGPVLGNVYSGIAQGTQSTTQVQDTTTFWPFPANVTQVAVGATSGQNTITVVSTSGIYPGMLVAVTTNTAGTLTLPAGTTVSSVTSATGITLSNTLSGTTGSTTFTFFATCTSSGTTITVAGYTTQGLTAGMYLGVSSAANITNTTTGQIQYSVAGAFVANGGTVLTNTYVTAVTSATTFTVSAAPSTPLVNAAVSASLWFANQWIGRRVRLLTGNATNYEDAPITGSTATGTISFGALTTAATTGITGYAILQQQVRGLGTNLMWNYGQSDSTRRSAYLYLARGGGSTGFDRLNFTTDFWDFLTPTPNAEGLQTGAMYAYDGGDRIYFTPQITQRVYYLDIDKIQIHGASQYPYVAAASAIIGNRMEIFTTVDGLKYLWLNRHGNQECFKLLLFF